MIKDSIVDWFKLYRGKEIKNGFRKNQLSQIDFNDFIMNRGIEFETKLTEYIHNNKLAVVTVSEYITDKSIKKTKELMRQGVPLIHSAPVKNSKNNTQGIIDLLIRNDYIPQLVNNCPIIENGKATKLGTDYHYVVIDIKFSTLPLRSDGIHLLNSGSYPAYKAQTWIYTQAIGQIQGFTPRYAYILGRRWKYISKEIKYNSYNCIDKLGVIDFLEVDKDYKLLTLKAIKWARDVRNYGNKWTLSPPSRIELYPNMCKDSGKWQSEKKKLAEELGEITSIWHCGINHRDNAMKNNIVSWRDINCTAKNMNMKMDGVRAPIIDKILNINRQNIILIEPKIIKSNILQWKNTVNEIFVDFETISDIFSPFSELPTQRHTDMIFMIGIYWNNILNNTDNWEYKNFVCKYGTLDEEYRIMNEFNMFLKQQNYPKMWYWHAEDIMWKHAENRQFDLEYSQTDIKDKRCNISDNWKVSNWFDMCKIFIDEPIVIKDCFKFGLKCISSAMKKHGMIKTEMDSICKSGMTACIQAWKMYEDNKDNENIENCIEMKDISKYNKFDVEVLYDIINYLRINHI
jgi:hypothetical protein